MPRYSHSVRRLYVATLLIGVAATNSYANLSNVALQYHATYRGPPPTNPAPGQGGTWTVSQPNPLGLGVPTWTSGFILHIPNISFPSNKKDLYLEIDYAAGARPAQAPTVGVSASNNGAITPFAPVAGATDWTYHWLIVPQPASEDLQFTAPWYFQLDQGVIGLEVGSICTPIPEPAMLSLLLAAPLMRRRR